MGVNPVIREAEAADSERLAILIDQLGFRSTAADIRARLKSMAQSGNRIFVAECDELAVGCLTTAQMQVVHRPAPVGRISMMVVDRAWRGKGIGRTLVTAAESALLENGCYLVEVTSRFDLEDAHRFYKRLGYNKTSVRMAHQLWPLSPCAKEIFALYNWV